MATTIVTKYGSDAPEASDIVRGELAVDTENGRLYTENAAGAVVEIGLKPEANVDVTGTITASGVVTANAGVVVDNFTLDGTTLALSSGNMTLDVAGDIILNADGGDVIFSDGATQIADFENYNSNFLISSSVQDKDLILGGNDGGSFISALTLDMSAAGAATFNSTIAATSATFTTADNSDTLSLISTDADASVGPNLRMYRNSGSPADLDALGRIQAVGRNDNSQDVIYSTIETFALDVSDGTEDAVLNFNVMQGGSTVSFFKGNNTEVVVNDDSSDLDFRVESDTNTHALFVEGSSGSVGIGTSSPTGSGLHVHNSTGGEQYISSSNSAMRFVSTGGINYIQSGTATSSSSAAPLVFTNVGGSGETMRIDSSGNVGIGVVPSASHYTSLEIGNSGSSITGRGAADTHFMSGLFWDAASTYKYSTSSVAVGSYQITNGIHYWATAAAGTAGNAATPQTNMTLDASGNLLVGKSSDDFATAGAAISQLGEIQITRASATPIYVRRNTSDGELIGFYKDGTTVGSLSTKSDDLVIHSSTTNHTGLSFSDGNILPTNNYGTTSTDTVDLGSSSRKFKDLYLSGNANVGDRLLVNGATSNAQLSVKGDASLRAQNVQVATDGHIAIGFFNAAGTDVGGIGINAGGASIALGGNAVANTLDDYEEGSFTPALQTTDSNLNVSYSTQHGSYTKIGNVVTIQIYALISGVTSQGTGSLKITGLPFSNGTLQEARMIPFFTAAMQGDTTTDLYRMRVNGAEIALYLSSTGALVSTGSVATNYFIINGTYKTA